MVSVPSDATDALPRLSACPPCRLGLVERVTSMPTRAAAWRASTWFRGLVAGDHVGEVTEGAEPVLFY